MATPRKTTAVDPLVAELPPMTEAKPESAWDVKFEVEISPYVVSGKTYFRFQILDHSFKAYAGDYTGHQDAGFHSATDAEGGASEYIDRIRSAVELKLNVPDSYTITL
jgi:hypothetical protein